MRLPCLFAGFVLLSLALSACSKPKDVPYTKLLYHNDVFSDPDTALPYSGVAKATYADGKPMAEYPFKNGKFEGTVKEWYPNGKNRATTEFEGGERVGKNTEWTEVGMLYRERVYDHDRIVSEKTYETGK